MNSDFSQKDYYLKIGRASDLKNPKKRILFRLFEIFPGALSWGILILAVILSWKKPLWVAFFIIIFVIFWFFRTIYFSFHLWISYKKMRKNEKADWIGEIARFSQWRNIYHLVIVPMYREPLGIVRDSLRSLEKTDYPKDKMVVVLACEERARKDVHPVRDSEDGNKSKKEHISNGAQETAEEIKKEFGSKFFRFMVTWHPADIPGEIAGKGSNETWAVKKTKEKIIDPLAIPYENIIFSSFDVDTCVFPKYFSCLSYYYLTAKKPTRTSFQPIPLYINNIWQAPAISRIFSFSATFWHTINQERQEKLITFSSHSMSFKALVDVGFKQTNVVSDDSRIFWQSFLKNNGDYRVQPLYYPVSMDANVSDNFWKTLINIYKQQKRWAYGMGDIPYFIFGFLENKKISLLKKFSLSFEIIGEHVSWATSSILIFLLGWLPLFLGGKEFSQTLISYNLPRIISRVMTISMLGLIISIYLSFLILPPKPPEYGRFKYLIFAFGWLLFPFMMIFFAALPALDAQTRWMFGKYMGFWVTEKFRENR